MSRALSRTLFLLVISGNVGQAQSSSALEAKTKNYIDTISGYDELSACAVDVLSTIVRDENSGCQDTYALTSYTCFCTDSSSFFSNAISRDVVAGCDSSIAAPQATSALNVFNTYCALGVAADSITTQTAATNSGSASPAASAPTTYSTQTSSPAPISPSQSQHSDIGTAIGAGVGVAAGLIGFALLVWFLWRRHQNAKQERSGQSQSLYNTASPSRGNKLGGTTEMPTYEHHVREVQGQESYDLPEQEAREAPTYYRPQELPGSDPRH